MDLLSLIAGLKWHRKESLEICGIFVVVIAVIIYYYSDYFSYVVIESPENIVCRISENVVVG